MCLFDTYWIEALRLLMPWAGLFFKVITELGSDIFYMALVATGFWVVDKRASKMTAFVLISYAASNYWLKIAFRNPRPPSTYWPPGARISSYGLPSGHAQGSMTLWGWLGIKMKTWWMGALSAALIVLIGLSRIYIGVHWLGDVLLGWLVGLLLLILLWKLEEPARTALSKYNPNMLYLGLVVFGLVAMILTELLTLVMIGGLEYNFGATGGLIIGLGIGLALESKYVNFEITPRHGEKWRAASRVIIGLTLIFVIMLGLSSILPSSVYWLQAIRYSLVVIVATFVWPLLFKKLGL